MMQRLCQNGKLARGYMKRFKHRILTLLISIVIASGASYFVFIPPSAFNFIPFAIHGFLFQNIIEEHVFIIVFDIIFVVVIFGFVFRSIGRKIKRN
jgi:uncharacterized RDD family membrane protein YckC